MQTIKAILVGNDDKSDGKLFYNPASKKLMVSSDYRLNITVPSGPLFNLEYSDPTSYTLYNDSIQSDAPAFYIRKKLTFHRHISHILVHPSPLLIFHFNTMPRTKFKSTPPKQFFK